MVRYVISVFIVTILTIFQVIYKGYGFRDNIAKSS